MLKALHDVVLTLLALLGTSGPPIKDCRQPQHSSVHMQTEYKVSFETEKVLMSASL